LRQNRGKRRQVRVLIGGQEGEPRSVLQMHARLRRLGTKSKPHLSRGTVVVWSVLRLESQLLGALVKKVLKLLEGRVLSNRSVKIILSLVAFAVDFVDRSGIEVGQRAAGQQCHAQERCKSPLHDPANWPLPKR